MTPLAGASNKQQCKRKLKLIYAPLHERAPLHAILFLLINTNFLVEQQQQQETSRSRFTGRCTCCPDTPIIIYRDPRPTASDGHPKDLNDTVPEAVS